MSSLDQPESSNSDEEFTLEAVAPDIFLCRERYYTSDNVANLYVVRGSKLDLVIDTGVGLWDFASFLRGKKLIGTKPYCAVATHIHFDHAGGLHQFENVAIHTAEATALEQGDSYEAFCVFFESECGKKPHEGWKPQDYKLKAAAPTRLLNDGDVFDLGDKQIEVLHLPGHSRGSIVLFFREKGILFSGDVVYDGTLYDFLPYSNVPDYVRSFERLVDLAPSVERVLPGHGKFFDSQRLTTLSNSYLDQATTCYECSLTLPKLFVTLVMKGKHTKEACPRCCYFACCCHYCI